VSRWRDLPPLSMLRAFDATAQAGSFAEAGRKLNVTHAAVAQAVRALEAELGLSLVRREGRTIRLTEVGERLARNLDDGFGTISDGIADLRRSEGRKPLRVATTVFLAQTLILPRLAEFWAKNPGVEVSMTPGLARVDVVAEGFDLALRAWQGNAPGTVTEPLAKSRWMVAGAPVLLGEGPVDVEKLPWIVPDDDHSDILRQVGIEVPDDRRVKIGSPHLEISAGLTGLGLILATEVVIRKELASGQLREVDLSGFPDVHYFVTMPSGPRRAETKAFVEWVRTLF
jgi:LysR family transcriptional regulator, glycine cleavage system transcriptional activator